MKLATVCGQSCPLCGDEIHLINVRMADAYTAYTCSNSVCVLSQVRMRTIEELRQAAVYYEKLPDFHMELWNWLAENPEAEKSNWPGWNCEEVRAIKKYWTTIHTNTCFACAASCDFCPIKWDADFCFSFGSVFRKWVTERQRLKNCRAKNRTQLVRSAQQKAIWIADAWGTNRPYENCEDKNGR